MDMTSRRSLRRIVVAAVALAFGLPAGGASASGAFVYADAGSSLWQFAADGEGALSPLVPPSVADPSSQFPASLVALPDGSRLFATLYNGQSVTGVALAADGTATFGAGLATGSGSQPDGMALTPDGTSLFVADHGHGHVLQYTVSAAGTLTAKAAPTVGPVGSATDVAVSPDGASAYAASQNGAVLAFDVTASGLVAKPGAAASASIGGGAGVDALAFTPDGRRLIAATEGGVQVFAVGAGGALTAVGGLVTGPPDGSSVVITPDGRSVYITGTAHLIYQYALAADGTLTPQTPASLDVGTMTEPLSIAPDGRSVYLSVGGAVHRFAVAATGALTPAETASTVSGGGGASVVTPDELATARFTAAMAPAGAASGFDASTTTDADGAPARYDWDFGDGATATTTAAIATHAYAAAGAYTVTLRVTDDRGCSAALWTGHQWLCHGGAPTATMVVDAPPAPAAGAPLSPAHPAVPVLPPPAAAARSARLVRHGSPKLTLVGGRFRLATGYALTCSAGPSSCRAKLAIALTRTGKRRLTGLTSASLTVKPGKTVVVTVAVKKTYTRQLKVLKQAKLTIALSSTVAGGTGAKQQHTVTLAVPRAKAKH
jgi:DNA-binding beta-propeller fold protein YncE